MAPNTEQTAHTRQEVLNVLLAQTLRDRALIAAPEQILNLPTSPTVKMPDVLVDLHGLRLAIEGEFNTGPQAASKVLAKSKQRVEQGVAHIGVGVLYPETLKSVPFGELKNDLLKNPLKFSIVTEVPVLEQLQLPFAVTAPAKPVFPFYDGSVDTLAEAIRRAYEQLVKEEVLENAVGLMEKGITQFETALVSQPATTNRFSKALGIRELPKMKKVQQEDEVETE